MTGCSTGRCGCKKNKKSCSEGCHINCNNLLVVAASAGREDNGMELMDVVVEEEVATPDDIEEMDELMAGYFVKNKRVPMINFVRFILSNCIHVTGLLLQAHGHDVRK